MEYERRQEGSPILSVVIIIIIIGVVVAVMLPVFTPHHHGGARKSSCQSNLKELGTALQLYHGDYDATLPSSVLYGGSKKWNESNFIYFASLRGQLPPSPTAGAKTYPQSWPMVLYPHMKNKDIIWCPSDPDRNDNSAGVRAPVSYYWKAAIDYSWYQGFRKEGDFNFPADQIIFYEHNGWHWGQTKAGLTEQVTINCTFLDGHTAAKRIKNSGYTKAENPPSPMPKSGIGEPAWFNCDYKSNASKTVKDRLWNPTIYGDNLP